MKCWVGQDHKQFCLRMVELKVVVIHLTGRLRCEQLQSDHLDGMRSRVVDKKNHVSE